MGFLEGAYKPKYEQIREEFLKPRLTYTSADLRCIETIIKTQCKPGRFNIMCLLGVGDNFVRLYADRYIRPKEDFNYIIPKGHEVLCEIMGVKDYTVLDTRYLKEFILEKQDIPEKYKTTLYHTVLNCSCRTNLTRGSYIGEGIAKNLKILTGWKYLSYPFSYLDMVIAGTIGSTAKYKIDISTLDYSGIPIDSKYSNSILLLPDSNSTPSLSPIVWDRLSEYLTNRGYEVLVDTKGTIPIHAKPLPEMSLRELISTGLSCKHIISLRNGMCDCLMVKRENLTILQPTLGTTLFDVRYLYKNPKAKVVTLDTEDFYWGKEKIVDKIKFTDILAV